MLGKYIQISLFYGDNIRSLTESNNAAYTILWTNPNSHECIIAIYYSEPSENSGHSACRDGTQVLIRPHYFFAPGTHQRLTVDWF